MAWRNSSERYGVMAIACHWLTAVAVIALFLLGLWMTSLTYYSPWYRTAPDVHRSIGILLVVLVIWRLLWKLVNPQPTPLSAHAYELKLAKVMHWLLYILLFTMFISGYLITTAEGQSLEVFNWFSLPALVTGEQLGQSNLEDVAGDLHELVAYVLIGLVCLHATAALKHHFWNRDATLVRMLGRANRGG